MKDFDAMVLSVVRARTRAGAVPDRPIVLCFTADEEAGGHHGAQVLVDEHTEHLAHCTEAIGEVGGFSTTIRGQRLYLIEAAEKGMAWMKLTARGRAGHGSMINDDNAVNRLTAAVARIGALRVAGAAHPFHAGAAGDRRRDGRHRGDAGERRGAGRGVRRGSADGQCGHPQHLQPDDAAGRLQGERVPTEATAHVDGRFLPGYEDEFFDTIAELCGEGIERSIVSHQQPWETPYDGDLVDAMTRSLLAEDPDARVAPYLMSAGTDAKHFTTPRSAQLRLHAA